MTIDERNAEAIRAYETALESLVLIDVVYLRLHPEAPKVGPLVPPYAGLKAAGVRVGRRQTECACVIHSSDDELLDLHDLLGGPGTSLADVDDVAAWRAAELRLEGDEQARVELREDRHPGYDDGGGPSHYRVVVVRGDGVEERFP